MFPPPPSPTGSVYHINFMMIQKKERVTSLLPYSIVCIRDKSLRIPKDSSALCKLWLVAVCIVLVISIQVLFDASDESSPLPPLLAKKTLSDQLAPALLPLVSVILALGVGAR